MQIFTQESNTICLCTWRSDNLPFFRLGFCVSGESPRKCPASIRAGTVSWALEVPGGGRMPKPHRWPTDGPVTCSGPKWLLRPHVKAPFPTSPGGTGLCSGIQRCWNIPDTQPGRRHSQRGEAWRAEEPSSYLAPVTEGLRSSEGPWLDNILTQPFTQKAVPDSLKARKLQKSVPKNRARSHEIPQSSSLRPGHTLPQNCKYSILFLFFLITAQYL